MPDLLIEAGGYYKDGRGYVYGPIISNEYHHKKRFPFYHDGSLFTKNGIHKSVFEYPTHVFHLVERVYPISESDYALLLQAKLDEELFKKAAVNMDKNLTETKDK